MTNTPDNKDDLVARLAKLEAKVEEMDRKTFSNFTVTDPATQNKIIQVDQDAAHSNRSHTQIRDSAGDVILSNDTVAGWGYAQPNVMYPSLPYNSWASTQINNGTAGATYSSAIIINSPRINFGFLMESSGGGGSAGGSMQVFWNTLYGTTTGTFTAMCSTQTISGAGYQYTTKDLTYLWPSNMYGQRVYITFWAQMTSGIGGGNWVSITPNYMYGAGQ